MGEIQRHVTIVNELGLHARAASKADGGWPTPVSEVTPPSPRPKAVAEMLKAAQRSNR